MFIHLKTIACIGSIGFSLVPQFARAQEKTKPNILLIITDQQSAYMMSNTGNPWVNTPNLDKLASQGIRFERAYTTNPVCVASRFSLLTGVMPSLIGMEDNDKHRSFVPNEVLNASLGNIFKNAGYETAYAGKTHLTGIDSANGYDNPFAYGFNKYLTPHDREGRDETVVACIDFMRTTAGNPFLLVASFINPHDICYMPLLDWADATGTENPYPNQKALDLIDEILEIPEGMSKKEFIKLFCPPLPDNFEIPDNELPSFTSVKENNYIGWSRRNYTADDWRLYRYLYARLTEDVDMQIGRLLNGLESTGLSENTLVIFTSDHGDQDASHRSGLKGYLYEESTNIPLIMRWTGVIPDNQKDEFSLISNGLDIIPTLCDFAGLPVPSHLTGMSMKPLALEKKGNWREYLVVENNSARLVLFDNTWKYMVDLKRETAPSGQMIFYEMLFDISNDKGEMNNLAESPSHKRKIKKGRMLLETWYSENDITIDGNNLNAFNSRYFDYK